MKHHKIILKDALPQEDQLNQLGHYTELIWARFGGYCNH